MRPNDGDVTARDLETLSLRLPDIDKQEFVSLRLDFEQKYYEKHGEEPNSYEIFDYSLAFAAVSDHRIDDILNDAVREGGLPEYVEMM